jgi:type IV fimbrial biogenesis protein FimT
VRHLTTNTARAASPEEGCRVPCARQAGVTLVELLTVMVIVAILMAIGVPSYRYVTTANRVATESNSLLADLQYARSEAVREGQQVSVCVSKNGSSCDSATTPPAWQEGWIIYSNPDSVIIVDSSDPLLRDEKQFNSTDTFQSSNSTYQITFSRDGFANLGAASMQITLHDSTANKLYSRCLLISQAGMMSVQTNTSDSGCT